MEATRAIQVPLQQDPQDFQHVSGHFCDVTMVESVEEQHGDLVDFSDGSVDVTVNYALTASDAPGLAILDSGCTRTMHGSEWSAAFEDALKKYDLKPQSKNKLQRFRGVGGETVSNTVKVYPVGIGGSHGELHSAETKGGTPLLLSRPFMQELGTIIDLANNTVSFRTLGVENLPLIKTSCGHMAISLLDFGDDPHGSFPSFAIPKLEAAD